MVIIDKVQEAVYQKSFQFIIKTEIIFNGLSLSFMEINDDVTKNNILSFEFQMFRFNLRERKDISCSFNPPVLRVEFFHPLVVHEKDAELSFMEIEKLKSLL